MNHFLGSRPEGTGSLTDSKRQMLVKGNILPYLKCLKA